MPLVSMPRRTFIRSASALTTAAAALAIAAFSAMPSLGAVHLESQARPELSVSHVGQPLLSASGLKPGMQTHQTVAIANRGATAGTLWLTITPTGPAQRPGSRLQDVLQATIHDEAGHERASTTLARFGSRRIAVLAAGAARRLTVTVKLPADVSAAYAGSTAGFSLDWTLES